MGRSQVPEFRMHVTTLIHWTWTDPLLLSMYKCVLWCLLSQYKNQHMIGYGRGFKAERRVIILWLKNSQFTYFTYKYIISITIARILKGHCLFVLLGDFT